MVIMGMRQQNEVRFQRVNINVRSLRITRYKRINKEMNTIYGNPQARMPVTCNFHTLAFWCKETPKIPHMRARYQDHSKGISYFREQPATPIFRHSLKRSTWYFPFPTSSMCKCSL